MRHPGNQADTPSTVSPTPTAHAATQAAPAVAPAHLRP
jgi:hypothetical protein